MTSDKEPRSYKRWVVRLTLFLASLYVLQLALDNPYTHSLLKLYLTKQMEQRGPIRLDFKALQVSALPLGVKVFGVNLYVEGHEDEALLTAARAEAKVSLWSLVLSNPRLSELNLVDGRIFWPPSDEVKKILEQKNDSNEVMDPMGIDLKVDSISLRQMNLAAKYTVATEDGPKDLLLSSEDLSFVLLSHPGRRLWAEVSSDKWQFEADRRVVLKNAHGRLKLSMRSNNSVLGDFSFRQGEADYQGRLQSQLDWGSTEIPKVQTRIESEGLLDFAILGALLDWEDTEGLVSFTANTALSFDENRAQAFEFESKGHVKSKQAKIEGFKLLDSAADLTIRKNGLLFENGRIEDLGKSVGSFGGKLSFDGDVPFDFEGEIGRVEVARLFDVLKIKTDFISGNLKSKKVLVRGVGEPFRMEVQAKGDLSNAKFQQEIGLRAVVPGILTDRWQSFCSFDLALQVREGEAKLDQIPIGCLKAAREAKTDEIPSVEIKPWILNGSLLFSDRGESADLSLKLPQVNIEDLSGLFQHDISGEGEADLRLHGRLDDLLVDSRFFIKRARAAKVNLSTVQGLLSISKERVVLRKVHAEFHNAGKLNLDHLDYDVPKRILQLSGHAEKIDSGDFAEALRLFGLEGPTFGIQTFNINSSIPMASVGQATGSLNLDLSDLAQNGKVLLSSLKGDFKGDPTSLSLEGLSLRYDDLCFSGRGNLRKSKNKTQASSEIGRLFEALGLQARSQISLDLQVSGEGCERKDTIEWDSLGFLTNYRMPKLSSSPSGFFKLRGELDGVEAELRLTHSQVRLRDQSMPDLVTSAKFLNPQLDIRVFDLARQFDSTLELDFKDRQYLFSLEGKQWDVRPFFLNRAGPYARGPSVRV